MAAIVGDPGAGRAEVFAALYDTPAYRQLLVVLMAAVKLEREVKKYLASHRAGCRCRYCAWLRRDGLWDRSDEVLREDLQAMLADVRAMADRLPDFVAYVQGACPHSL